MKNQWTTSLLSILFLLLFSGSGFSQWQTHTTGMPEDLRTMYFTDCNTGWVAGKRGYMKKTTNAATNWTNLTTGTTKDINSVFFIDSNTGWFVGKDGMIKKTTDGGTTWTSQVSGTSHELSSVHFYDSNSGLAVGDDGIVLKTSDGGANWFIASYTYGEELTSILFISSTTGYAAGKEGILVKTTDGGTNWSLINTNLEETLESLSYSNGSVFACSKEGAVIKISSANTVSHIQSGTSKDLKSIHFIPGTSVGWVVGEEGRAYYTVNGGANWMVKNVSTNSELVAVQFLSTTCGYAAGEDGRVYSISGGTVSVDESSIETLSIYPNPVTDKLSVQCDGTIESIEIYATSGQLIKTVAVSGNKLIEADLSELKSGTYLVHLKTASGTSIQKIVKQ